MSTYEEPGVLMNKIWKALCPLGTYIPRVQTMPTIKFTELKTSKDGLQSQV